MSGNLCILCCSNFQRETDTAVNIEMCNPAFAEVMQISAERLFTATERDKFFDALQKVWDSKSAEWMTKAMAGADKAVEVKDRLRTYLGQVSGEFTKLDLLDTCCRIFTRLEIEKPENVMLDVELPQVGPAIFGNANEIVTAHGGVFTVDTVVGRESTF